MSEKIKTIMEDEREVEVLRFPVEGSGSHIVGSRDVEKIVPYWEADMLFFAIYVKGKIRYRVNAAHVETVVYKESE